MKSEIVPVEIEILHEIEDPIDDNVDVVIRLSNGESRTATFFTLANIATIMERHALSGESLSGVYFWATEMIIVRELTEDSIRNAVFEIVRAENYAAAFGKIESSLDDVDGIP